MISYNSAHFPIAAESTWPAPAVPSSPQTDRFVLGSKVMHTI